MWKKGGPYAHRFYRWRTAPKPDAPHGWQRWQAAEHLGISIRAIEDWEQGNSIPGKLSILTLIKLKVGPELLPTEGEIRAYRRAKRRRQLQLVKGEPS